MAGVGVRRHNFACQFVHAQLRPASDMLGPRGAKGVTLSGINYACSNDLETRLIIGWGVRLNKNVGDCREGLCSNTALRLDVLYT